MAITFNETTVAAQQIDRGVARQRLLTNERVNGTSVLLDRITLAPGAAMRFDLSQNSLAWLQVLEGGMTFKAYYTDRMSEGQSAYLPPGFSAALSTDKGATLLCAEIPDVGRLDPDHAKRAPLFIVADWMREPVLASEHDTRARVELANPDMCDAAAIKVEMVIYPAGTMAPECHHEGAATIMYILAGHGTAKANGQQYPVGPGDVIYFPDRERHAMRAGNSDEMRFLEIHAPALFKTAWTDPGAISAWRLTDRDIHGRETLLDENERKAFRFVFPFPVM